jgi:hypothetical protein
MAVFLKMNAQFNGKMSASRSAVVVVIREVLLRQVHHDRCV